MQYRQFGDTYFVRIDRGEEVVESLIRFASENAITLAEISGIGAASFVEAGHYDVRTKEYSLCLFTDSMKRVADRSKYTQTVIDTEGFEILSLAGTFTTKGTEPYLHLHITLSDVRGVTHGGHLNSAIISGTCELTIKNFGGKIGRKLDEETGLNLFDFKE